MNTPVKPILIVFSILFWVSVAQAQVTYYVSPTGNNANPGTITQPFATLQKAHDIANPGDTIYMRGGTYQFTSGQALTRDGTSGNPIRVFAYPGEVPVIDAINMTTTGYVGGFPVSLLNASWWHIKGLEIKNGPSGGLVVYLASSNNIIENNNVHHNGRLDASEGKGIVAIGSGANNLFLNNDSHHNRDQSSNGGNADGFQIALTGSGNVIRGNRAWFNSDDGFDFFNVLNGTTEGAYLVENNWSWRNGFNDALQPLGNGEGFKLGGIRLGTGGHAGAHTVRNNISFKNKSNGIVEAGGEGGAVPLTIYNNSSYSNGSNSYIFLTAGIAHVLRNNYEYANAFTKALSAAVIQDHNSWNLSITITNADFQSVDFSGMDGPRNADGSLPTINFLRLAASSNLIDKGVDVGIPYNGSAPDLGAFEYANPVAAVQAPTNLVVQ